MSSETMQPDLAAQVYYLRKKVDEIATTLKEQGALLSQAAISRERTSNEVHQIHKALHALGEADREQRDEAKSLRKAVDDMTAGQLETPLHVVEETSNRSKMWAAIAAFFTAAVGWAAGWFSGGR